MKRHAQWWRLASATILIVLAACGGGGDTDTTPSNATAFSNATGPTPLTFTKIQSQILTPTCAVSGCHSGGSPAAGMDLSAPAYARIVTVASSEVPSLLRIAPGSAANSYLIRKLEGAPGTVGSRMPLTGPFLDQATVDRIRAWIDVGAPNN